MAAPSTRPKPRFGLDAIAARARANPIPPAPPSVGHQAATVPQSGVDAPTYAAGAVIASKYKLTSLLGEGGMGAVWLARNVVLDMDVAVKLIRREMATPETEQRLLVEARATARLGHPSIVRIFDFGETEFGDPFIVMELLDGESLGDVLERVGRLPAENAVQTILPIASALAAVHSKDIIHRDLKPDNILLTTAEAGGIIPKVVDFGIAKLEADDLERKATRVGTIVGSPDYLSPEQARGGERIDARADVWSLAVVLYEAITGAMPFQGANYHALLRAIIEDAPAPTTAFGAGDPELWAIIERGLAKDPDKRWPTMRAFGRALAAWAVSRGIEDDIAGLSLQTQWLHESDLSGARGLPSQSELLLVPPTARASNPDDGPVSERRKALSGVRAPTPAPITDSARTRAARAPTPEPASTAAAPAPAAAALASAAAAPAPTAAELAPTIAVRSPAFAPARSTTAEALETFRPKRRWPWVVAVLAAIAAAATFARGSLHELGVRAGLFPSDAAPEASADPNEGQATTPGGLGAPSPSASAASGAAANAPSSADVNQCAMSMFADGTFASDRPARLASMCSETDPRRGASIMKEQVMRGGKPAIDGIREWASLGSYELAAFAVIRDKCCGDPPRLVLPPPIGGCAPIDAALNKLADAAGSGKGVDAALRNFTSDAQCALRVGAGKTQGLKKFQGNNESEFKKTLARALAKPKAPTAPAASAPQPRPAPKRSK